MYVGVYVAGPPRTKEIEGDKSSLAYQRTEREALRKSINGLLNKVNEANIKNIIPELFSENLIRGRGLFCRACIKSQMASPCFTDVFAALASVVNTEFPEIGRLLVGRIVLVLKRAYKRSDKPQLVAALKFIAHLVKQQVVDELIALELLENPTRDSAEVAVAFVTKCGSFLVLQDHHRVAASAQPTPATMHLLPRGCVSSTNSIRTTSTNVLPYTILLSTVSTPSNYPTSLSSMHI
ncbi:pre-mRNA-splicing factor CWC22-like [Salvia hispanica]|uniref:pre-mRNA-splicing factor CWC22-like n=1 Tax=Salvia hispanica TaxID=49212 RepID=UPI002008FC01|nr:pre-mRNA-splicing factor CWC22-like [Salvia hispanica]